MATSKSEAAPAKGGRNEAVAALAVGFICLALGVPLWWKTTTTYRASLPYAQITQIFKEERTVCTVPVTVICDPDRVGQSFKQLETQMHTFLRGGNDGSVGMSIEYTVYARKYLTLEKRMIGQATSLQDLDEKLDAGQRGSVGHLSVYMLAEEAFQDNVTRVYMGSHRSVFIHDNLKSLEYAASFIRSVLINEESLNKHYKTAKEPQTVADLESMRSFRFTPGYELSFNLLVPEPHNLLPHWDLNQAQKVFLDPLLVRLREFAEFTVASQVLYYMTLSVKPKSTPGESSFFFPQTSLPHIITPIEAKLGSHVTNFPNLNFVVYVPPLDQTPLYIHSNKGEPVSTNAFLSPRWGGVLIYNNPKPDENASKPMEMVVDNYAVMPVFLSQLRLLLGIPTQSHMETITMEKPGETALLDWEYDSLLRRHCIENLASASASLYSLSQLLERISNIVINDDIAKQVYTAVESIRDGHRYLQAGSLHPAFHASKRAHIAAEKAFFDPSLLELLYFPEDQKFAIYIPLFLPISIPVVLSLGKAIQWVLQQRRSRKEKTE